MKKALSFALAFIIMSGLLSVFGSPVALAAGAVGEYGYTGPTGGKFLAAIDPPESGSVAISTRSELEAINSNLSGKYHLTADIDLYGAEWVPIGDDTSPFTGTFDGQGYIIIDLKITDDFEYAGLFGFSNGAIKNVGLEGTDIDIDSPNAHAGAICGNGSDISNCYNTGVVSATSDDYAYAGGICGDGVDISNCYNTGAVSASNSSASNNSYAGGICGISHNSISNCYNTGVVSATSDDYAYAGGICGDNGNISNCYNTGAISATSTDTRAYAGGICGGSGDISNCYNTGDVSSTANVDAYAGAICGSNGGETISNCYWNSDSVQTVNGFNIANADKKGVDNGTDTTASLTSIQMQGIASKDNFAGFDFDTVWGYEVGVNNNYPILFVAAAPPPPPTPTTYSVTVTGGTGGGDYEEGEAVNITATVPTGQQLVNWTIAPSVTFTSGSATSTTFSFNMPTNNVTVTANYELIPSPTTYTVTYNGNNNTGGTAPTDSYSPYSNGATVTVLGNTGTLTRTGYTFSGWNTQANGQGVDCAAGSTFNINADTTLYARWTPATVSVTGVTLNKATTALTAGNMETLTATVNPSNATNKAVQWSSNNPSAATVNTNGVVTAVGAGTATITVTTVDGAMKDYCSVTVTEGTLEYNVTVNSGTSNKSKYAQGELVSITANAAPAGQRFKNWTTLSSGVSLVNANNSSTSFSMPANAVTITANYVSIEETTDVTFTAVQVGGTSGTANSTGIQITFSQAVSGLTASDITVTNDTGKVVQGALSGSGAVYTLKLSSITTQGNVIVSIASFGTFNVDVSRTVAVYKNLKALPADDDIVYGDLTGKGYVDNSDLILMFRFFSNPNLAIDLTAVDVNGDGVINNADMILLLKYFTQPGIKLGPQ